MVRKSSYNWCQSFDVFRPTPSPHSHESPSFGTMGEGGKRARDLILRQFESVPRFRSVPQWLSQTIRALRAPDLLIFFLKKPFRSSGMAQYGPIYLIGPFQAAQPSPGGTSPIPHLSLQTAMKRPPAPSRTSQARAQSPPPHLRPAPRCGLKASLGDPLPRAQREGAGQRGSLTAPRPRAGVSEQLGAFKATPRPEGRGCSPAAGFSSGLALGLGARRSSGAGCGKVPALQADQSPASAPRGSAPRSPRRSLGRRGSAASPTPGAADSPLPPLPPKPLTQRGRAPSPSQPGGLRRPSGL